jgi:hypothetical protein
MLELLRGDELRVTELAEPFGISLAGASSTSACSRTPG